MDLLSCIRILASDYFVLSQARVLQTDGRTDGQTEMRQQYCAHALAVPQKNEALSKQAEFD